VWLNGQLNAKLRIMPAGRPSLYNPELVEKILVLMYSGKSLRSICKQSGMPDKDTVSVWRIRHPEFAVQYARARRAQVEARMEDSWEILAETPTCTVPDPDGGTSTRVDGAAVQLLGKRADHARWEASKLLRGPIDGPLDYGDKQDVALTGSVGVTLLNDIPRPNKE
jgi:hypothetical protein